MIKLEKTEVVGWEHAIRGARNPMNSWKKSDSYFSNCDDMACIDCFMHNRPDVCNPSLAFGKIGPNDHDLMMRLRNAGTDHRKFMRMIVGYTTITAPL